MLVECSALQESRAASYSALQDALASMKVAMNKIDNVCSQAYVTVNGHILGDGFVVGTAQIREVLEAIARLLESTGGQIRSLDTRVDEDIDLGSKR